MKFDVVEMILENTAKSLAWDDLDNNDKRVYLREAQKQLAKERISLFDEYKDSIEKMASKYDTPKSKKKSKR